jgi:tetratricopeptide (TPR) repeat protein
MDAQQLFREGVLALRERKDAARARDLLTQSLRANPDNEMAWLWLARTYTNKEIQLQCVERALRINPANEQALAFKERLVAADPPAAPSQVSTSPFIMEPEEVVDHRSMSITGQPIHLFEEEPEPPEPTAPVTMQTPLAPAEEKQVAALLAKAKQLAAADDMEGAIEQWVYVLDIRVDHPEAIQNATRALAKLKYLNDVETLLNNAIEAGTNQPSIYMTAMDMARHKGEIGEMEMLMEQVAKLPAASEEIVERMVKHFTADQPLRAVELLREVVEQRPESARLSLLMGDLLRDSMMQPDEAEQYYERAAQGSSDRKIRRTLERSKHGRVPVIGDRERGSVALALREALGFSAVYLLMGWQDAGLNLLSMGVARWLGVGLAFVGGYALITATSSPQQRPLAGLLGGKVPPPQPKPERKKARYEEEPLPVGPVQEPTDLPILSPAIRIVCGILGALILAGAFALVFSTALQLLRNPVPPDIPSLQELMSELEEF